MKEWAIAVKTESDTSTYIIGSDGGVVADTFMGWRDKPECEANAKLIIAAVNACIKINKDDPQAVAGGIGDLYEACNTFQTALRIWQLDPSKAPKTLVTIFVETIGKALANKPKGRAEGK